MEYGRTYNKIKLLFEKINEPNYVMNNYYADALINKLKDLNDPEVSNLASIPLVPDLLINAWSTSEKYHLSVNVFLHRLLACAASYELHFVQMFARIGDKIGAHLKEINSPSTNPSLKVSYVEVAIALLNHNSGIAWLLEKEVWKDILIMTSEKNTVFVIRQVYKFAAKFLWKLNDLGDKVNLALVLNFILKPILETDIIHITSVTNDEEEIICKQIEPMLNVLLAVFSEEQRVTTSSVLLNSIVAEHCIINHVFIFFERVRNEQTVLSLAKIGFWATLSKMLQAKPLGSNVIYTLEDFLDLNVLYFNIVHFLIKRRSVKLVLEFSYACNKIWNAVWQDQKPLLSDDTKKMEIQNQILFICLVPIYVYSCNGMTATEIMSNENISSVTYNILKTSSEHTGRVAYALRELMQETDSTSAVLQSVKMLTCLKTHLTDDQANIMFQSLFLILKDFAPVDEKGNQRLDEYLIFNEDPERVVVMMHVMEIVLSLVKRYNIHWKESLEILCLFSVVYFILKRPNLPPRFVVISLNVLTLSVKKFLPPNLSLLLECQPDSAMYGIGDLINNKLHEMHWEVRDSALELLLVCTELSFIKFPPFQKHILEKNLINAAAAVAFNDYESYVRASALKCLGAASKTMAIWEQLKTQYPTILELLLSTLRSNPEGIVRKEACNVLCEIYQNIKITPCFKSALYENMLSSALGDFHWEVQISALKFWRIVIQSVLTEHGMIDGRFPPVTFSKQSRKIVTLNKTEVQMMLLRTLDELSAIGCLTVLVKILADDSEIELLELALTMSHELLNLLDEYELLESIKPNEGDPSDVDELICENKEDENNIDVDEASQNPTQEAENVIEGILRTDDINLLARIYERHMSLNNQNQVAVVPKIRLLKSASPHLFVTYVKSKDFREIIEEKKKWKEGIRSLSSLLDDTLGIYEINEDVNSLDCY